MARVWLVATKAQRYGSTWVQRGEVFSASREHAKVLKAVKHAVDAPSPETLERDVPPSLVTAAVELPTPVPIPVPDTPTESIPDPESVESPAIEVPSQESEPEPADPHPPAARRRLYQRRDMTAED